jgi:hypothetical protein
MLRSDPTRWLRMVDPSNRELLLSFGALLETIRQAAPAIGYRIEVHVVADRAAAPDVAQVDLIADRPLSSNAPALIQSRATTRTPYLPVELAPNDIAEIVGLDRAALAFVPRKSPKGRWLAEAATEAFAQQTADDRKQAELAAWLRFSRSDIRVRRDGLTPEALGLPLISRAAWYAAFSRKQAMKPSFRRSSIKIAGKQLNGCAGFLLVTSTDRSVSSLLGAGSVYQRALLRATDLRVAHHTMSYALEEDPWRQEIDSAMQSERPIQFMVRIGQARRLARPTIRRSMATLLENGMP